MNRDERIERGRRAEQAMEVLHEVFGNLHTDAVDALISEPLTNEQVLDARAFLVALDKVRSEMLHYIQTGNDDVKLAEQEQQRGR
jgi:hypothetical protein